jgi:hypothetical protein
MPQSVEVDGILVAARDRTDARHHHFEHRVPDAARITPIRHRIGKPSAAGLIGREEAEWVSGDGTDPLGFSDPSPSPRQVRTSRRNGIAAAFVIGRNNTVPKTLQSKPPTSLFLLHDPQL